MRKWINRDNGRWFRIGNESLNAIEVLGYFIFLSGILLGTVKAFASFKWYGWTIALFGFLLAGVGNFKKNKQKETAKKAIQEDFIIVTISTGLTMNEESNPIVTTLIASCSPSFWQMHNPDSYEAYFRSTDSSSRQKADKLLSSVQRLITTDDRFADFKVGINEGNLLVAVASSGNVTFPPLGEAVNIAYRNQKGRQDL